MREAVRPSTVLRDCSRFGNFYDLRSLRRSFSVTVTLATHKLPPRTPEGVPAGINCAKFFEIYQVPISRWDSVIYMRNVAYIVENKVSDKQFFCDVGHKIGF